MTVRVDRFYIFRVSGIQTLLRGMYHATGENYERRGEKETLRVQRLLLPEDGWVFFVIFFFFYIESFQTVAAKHIIDIARGTLIFSLQLMFEQLFFKFIYLIKTTVWR